MTDLSFIKTATEFINYFATKYPDVKFVKNSGGLIRDKKLGLCPVCYLTKLETNFSYKNSRFLEAAYAVKLNLKIANIIANNADGIARGHVRRVMQEKIVEV